jgi:KEOPS complex subunit Pcc1
VHETTLVLEYDDPDVATIVERSVGQEIGDIQGDRTEATLSRSGGTITISIEADDLVALRAGHNTWLGLIEVAEQSADLSW